MTQQLNLLDLAPIQAEGALEIGDPVTATSAKNGHTRITGYVLSVGFTYLMIAPSREAAINQDKSNWQGGILATARRGFETIEQGRLL